MLTDMIRIRNMMINTIRKNKAIQQHTCIYNKGSVVIAEPLCFILTAL